MVDMGFVGSRFMWSRGTVQECLDRFVCNEDWKDRVNMFRVAHLTRVQSNHSPLLLSYESVERVPKQHRPFHFLVAWGTNANWKPFVQEQWDHEVDFVHALAKFSHHALAKFSHKAK